MIWIYNIAVGIYSYSIWLASFFNKKAKLWIDGRKSIFEQLETQLQSLNHEQGARGQERDKTTANKNIIWMHVASLGEFEQGRPIIEKLKEKFPNYKILLTFFSPSGFEIRKNYELADYIFYLPSDNQKNAQKFIELVNPKLVIFVK